MTPMANSHDRGSGEHLDYGALGDLGQWLLSVAEEGALGPAQLLDAFEARVQTSVIAHGPCHVFKASETSCRICWRRKDLSRHVSHTPEPAKRWCHTWQPV